MADGGHFGFGHSEIRGRVAGKHLGDFLCLGTHELSSNEKFSQTPFCKRVYTPGPGLHPLCQLITYLST